MTGPRCRAWRCEKASAALGFCMRHYKQHRRGLDPTRPRPEIGDQIDEGTYGVLETSEDGELVRCHICGRWFRSVGSHAAMAHGVDSRTYRERYGLPRLSPLISPALSRARSEGAKSRVGSAGWARFEEARDPQAASDARDFTNPSPVTARGRAGRVAAVTPRVEAAKWFCEVCGAECRSARAKTCSPECVRVLKARNARAAARRRVTPLTGDDVAALQAAGLEDLRGLLVGLYRRGVRSAEIARVLGVSSAWLSQHYPRSIADD